MHAASLLIALGSALSVLGMLGTLMYGRELADVFLVLVVTSVGPTQAGLTWLMLSALVFAIGLLVLQRGVRIRARERALSFVGRGAILLSSTGLVLAGGLLFAGLWGLRDGFFVLASADTAPNAGEVQRMVALAAGPITCGLWVAGVGMVPLMALHFGGLWPVADANRRTVTGSAAVLIVSLAAIAGYFLSLVLACRAGLAAVSMTQGPAAPMPSEVAEELTGVLRFGLLAAVGLSLIGATQALTVFTFPQATRPAG